MKVLIIEDAPEIAEAVSISIEWCWPEAKIISTSLGEQGIYLAGIASFDMIILDLSLPDVSGFDVLKRMRLFSDIPILILTVTSDVDSIVKGLEWGADDYIIKPFSPQELLYRLQVVSRWIVPKPKCAVMPSRKWYGQNIHQSIPFEISV